MRICSLVDYFEKFKTEDEVEAMTDAEYEDYVEEMIEADQWMQEEGRVYMQDFNSIVERTANYWVDVVETIERTGTYFWAWDAIEEFIVDLLIDYELPLELVDYVRHQAAEQYEDLQKGV